ncbi:MAG: hypothetical protein GY866_41140 [Proteobacteria bacterium]|nr:hypothetical protein [Pseudomonadota bacterium]
MGANAQSSIFYNRVKGEVEKVISDLPFKSVHIFRPSLIMGNRQESRKGEQFAISLFKLFSLVMAGPLKKYRAIEAKTIAFSMIQTAKTNREGVHTLESDRIQSVFDTYKKEGFPKNSRPST